MATLPTIRDLFFCHRLQLELYCCCCCCCCCCLSAICSCCCLFVQQASCRLWNFGMFICFSSKGKGKGGCSNFVLISIYTSSSSRHIHNIDIEIHLRGASKSSLFASFTYFKFPKDSPCSAP